MSNSLHAQVQKASMENLSFYLPHLVGKLLEDPDTAKVYSVEGESLRNGLVSLKGDHEVVRKRKDVVFTWFVLTYSTEKKDGSREAGTEVKELLLALLKRCKSIGAEKVSAKKAKRHLVSKRVSLKMQLGIAEVQEERRGLQPSERYCTLGSRLEACEEQLQSASDELEAIISTNQTFASVEDIRKFFKEKFKIDVCTATLYKWRKYGVPTRPVGRQVAFSNEDEQALLDTVLYCDSMGWPLSRSDIMELAMNMAESEEKRSRFGKNGPTIKWYNGWYKRMSEDEPDLIEACTRGRAKGMTSFFTSKMINWWFDCVKKTIIKFKFAKPSDTSEEEVIWLTPARVFNFDETCTSGGLAGRSDAFEKAKKVVTLQDRLDSNGKRRTLEPKETGEHHTLVGGANLLGQRLPASWILSAKTDIQPKQRQDALIKGAAPTVINNREITRCFVNTSEHGGVTLKNIENILTELIDEVWPDVADEDGKRVLVFCDWHGSRFNLKMLETFIKKGIVLVGFLPNCTSVMQAMDVLCFGNFKASRKIIESKWKRNNPGKVVDRMAKLEIAAAAYQKAVTQDTIMAGFKATGIYPMNRNVLLDLPVVKDCDRAEEESRARFGTAILEHMANYSQENDLHFDEPPRLGPLRILEDREDMSRDSLTQHRSHVVDMIEEQVIAYEEHTNYVDNILVFDTKDTVDEERKRMEAEIEAEIEAERKRKKAEMEAKLQKLENSPTVKRRRLNNIKENLRLWKSNLEAIDFNSPDGIREGQRMVARVQARVEDLSQADLDNFGLPIHPDGPRTPIKFSLPSSGVSYTTLQNISSSAAEAFVKDPTGNRKENDNSARITAGDFLFKVGTPVATSKKAIAVISEASIIASEKTKNATSKAQMAAETEAEKRRTVLDRLRHCRAMIQADIDRRRKKSVKSMRSWIKLVLENAKYNKDVPLEEAARAVSSLKGDEFSESFDVLYQMYAP